MKIGKKLKRRLEDLERRAGSSDDAESEKQSPASSTKSNSKRSSASSKSQKAQAAPPSKPVSQAQFTPPMEHNDEFVFSSGHYDRERSNTPPLFSYPTYPPPPDELLLAPYGSTGAAYPTMTTAEGYPNYIATSTVPVTLPSMTHFSDAVKREVYPSDEGLNPYMNYGGFVPGMDYNAPSPYEQSHPHTPPLSHSFDHSANCSEAGYDYPTTPLSMPGSPGMIIPQH